MVGRLISELRSTASPSPTEIAIWRHSKRATRSIWSPILRIRKRQRYGCTGQAETSLATSLQRSVHGWDRGWPRAGAPAPRLW